MADSKQSKHDSANGSISPLAAAVTGAVVGAGMAIAGAVVMNNEDNRDKVKEVLTNIKDQAMGHEEKTKALK